MTSNFIFMEKVVSLPPARNYQVHSKFFMADQADRCETEAHTKAKEDKCHPLRELPPIHATQGRQLGTSNCECEPSWS